MPMASTATRSGESMRTARLRFVATIFTGSFLLFLVQPMIARMVLPRLGGAPAVWNSAMLVYQALLLAGYAYAHWLGRFAPRRQAALHLGLFAVAALMLPIGLVAAFPSAGASPFVWVPWLLIVSIGPLFFVVSAQAPLIQRWFALSGGGDPYPLYAASNLGSFAGLLSYPLVVELLLPIDAQRWLWSAGYVALALMVGWCALALPRGGHTDAAQERYVKPAGRTIAMWILLAAVPSGLVLSTTLFLTTDIVAMPLLWVLPLGAYLLSFTVAFSSRRGAANAFVRLAPIALLIGMGGVFNDTRWFGVPIAVFTLFAVSVALHSQLFDRRPGPSGLTFFYLTMSIGGVLGGIFCALIAPLVFDWTYEHPLLLIAAALLLSGPSLFERFAALWNDNPTGRVLTRWAIPVLIILSLGGLPALGLPKSVPWQIAASMAIFAIGIVAIGNRILFAAAVAASMLCLGGWDKLALSAAPDKMMRSFFGIYQIYTEPTKRQLIHGTTLHGVQNLGSPERERMATSYYARLSGVGMAMAAAPQLFGPNARVGVIGLGAGTLACYAQPGQSWTFYEIDPLVAAIATNPRQFTFLSRCKPDAAIRIGDARLLIDQAPAAATDLLVVDAFTSDSVPMHLLTREAFAGYRRHLTSGGLLLMHISNRYFDFEPVVAAAARDGWYTGVRDYFPDRQKSLDNESVSRWIALSPSRRTIDELVRLSPEPWQALPDKPGFAPWTDQHASILPLIMWRS